MSPGNGETRARDRADPSHPTHLQSQWRVRLGREVRGVVQGGGPEGRLRGSNLLCGLQGEHGGAGWTSHRL
jgi:hypothetical protein